MKINNFLKGLYCAFFLLLSSPAFADWTTLDNDISISKSKPRYVRGQNAYIVQIKITNNGSEMLTGPFRVLIENATLSVKDQDGKTDDDVPYFDLIPTKLMPHASIPVTARFDYSRRTLLTFDASFQSNQPLDLDNDGVIDDLDLCPDTAAGSAVDDDGCLLIPPTTDNGLPIINFELGGTGADFTWNVFENVDNPAVQFVANPDSLGINPSTTAAMFTARQDGAPWVGAESSHGDIGPITLDATNSILKIMVYKTVISDVALKLAIANGGAQPEIKVANTLINQWEELTFDFSGNIGLFESINVDQVIVFPDFDFARSKENVVYFDNITFNGNGTGTGDDTGTGNSISDFEGDAASYSFSDFDGGVATIAANPEMSGNNTSAQVGQMQKFAGQHWGGTTYTLPSAIDINDTVFTMKVWSQRAVPVLFKIEGMNVERSANHTGSGWEELTFDFIGDTGTGVTAITLIFDLGIMGDAAGDPTNWTFYFDDINIVTGDTGSGTGGNTGTGGDTGIATINFEASGTGAAYSWNVFENTDNPAVEIVANPDTTGANTSTSSAKFTARSDGAPWAGLESAHGEFGPLTLDATNSIVKIMVYKTVISDVGLKFSIANGGAQPEIKVANTLVNQWEELTFDFSSHIGAVESINIDQIIVFPDFDSARTQENVVYFDNISFSDGSGGGDTGSDGGDTGTGGGDTGTGDTGTGGGDTGSADELLSNSSFDNGIEGWNGGTVIAEGDNNVFTAEVAAPGNPWDVNLSQVMTIVPDATYVLSFKAKASVARTIIAGLGLAHDPWTNITETVALSTEWQSFTYTLTTSSFGDDNSRVLFDMGSEAGTVYLDDISVTLQSGADTGTGGGDTGGGDDYVDTSTYFLEPPTDYVRTTVNANDPSTYNITHYGAGNISDGINPNGYTCTYDYGNWIGSAGVTEPGVSGCDPIGTPTYRHPQVVGDIVDDPTPTHKWWGSIPFHGEMAIGDPNQAAYITPDPIAARVSNKGVRVLGIPTGMRGDDGKFVYAIPDPFNEVFDGIAVANSAFDELDAYLKDYSDGSVTVQWQSGNKPVMEATFVHGSPYIYFKAFRGQIIIKTKAIDSPEKGTFYQQGNSLGVWTSVAGNRNDYLITGEGTTSFSNVASNEITVTNDTNEVTLTLLPPNGAITPSDNTSDFFANLARNVVRKVDIDYSVDRSNNSVTVSHRYLDSDGNAVETAAGMLPMAWKNSAQAVSGHKVRSARGIVKFSQTSAFSYGLPFVGVLPTLPSTIGDLDNQYLIDLVTEFYNKGPNQWNLNNDGNVANDTYWAGKSYGKMAEMAAIARSIGMDVEADAFIVWLKSELEDWFTADTNGSLDTEKYFVYDEEWSTLLGMQESYGSHQSLNDHHFHYGYFVRAAAEICRIDFSWCGSDQYGPMIDLLIRDYAASKDDDMFPYLRNFDPANGFSWASGNANFALGNNNESTSEAANSYGAIALYGMITGNDALVEKGMYLHASSTSAYWEYWNNIDRFRNESSDYPDRGNDYDNFPADYNRITTSIIWGTGSSFSTWFSGANAHILGIQGLPLNPLVLHVGQYPDYMEEYVALGLEESSNGKPSGLADDHWRDIWWNLWAMTDADASFADYQTMGSNYAPETGESKAHTYHWVKTWQELGHLKTGTGALTANHPAAVAFENDGFTTYVAYNFSDSEITVQYSNGQALVVAAHSFNSIKTVSVDDGTGDTGGGDTGGGDAGGDTGGTVGDTGASDVPTVNFDSLGSAYAWNVFENVDNPAVEIVANPDAADINTSATVAKFTARSDGAPWAGAESAHGDFGPMTLDATNSIVKIMVYKTVISDVGIKFAIANGGAQPEIKVANTLVNQWEELSFDFSGQIGAVESIDIDQIIVFPDFDFARSQENVVYFDNISFSNGAAGDSGGADTGTGDTEPHSNWSMVWNDEFEGTNIDLSKWEHEVNCSGGGNNEKQCYTSNPENSFVDSGLLKIVAKPETGQALPYSSARLRTKYKGDWKYGRVEVRAKPPQGQGSFPAIWMLPTDEVYGGWPHSGEIDIFESVNLKTVNTQGVEEANVHGNLWYGRSWPNQSNSGASFGLPEDANPADGFHTYAIEWEEGEIRWYVDGYLYQTQLRSQVNIDSDGDANGLLHRGWFADYANEFHWDNSPFNQDFHLILNFAVGGDWSENVNNGGIDASAFNADNAFEFDYVRVYECSVNPTTGQGCASVRDGYLDPINDGGSLVNGDAPTPIKPSTGEATDLIVFENTLNENWPAWNCCDDAAPTVVVDDVEHAEVLEFSIGATPTVVGFNTSVANLPAAYDGSPMLTNGWLEFDMKLVTPPNNASANWNLKVEQGGTTTEALIQIDTPTAEWQHYAVSLQTLSNAGLNLNGIDVIMIFPDWGQGEGAVFRVDNVTILQGEDTGGGDTGSGGDTGGNTDPVAGEEILTNGSFENGTNNWIGAVAVNTEGDNTFYQADVAVAGNPWDVNLSQIMSLIPGEIYVLSFKAKASVARSIIAGLGLNSDPWTNVTETVALTTEWQTFTYVFTVDGFGDDNSRVLFDLGAEAGSVYIDDVSVMIQADTGGSAGGVGAGGPVVGDEFVIVSSTGITDVNLTPDTIGEWSTGTVIQADVTFDGLMGWELTSSANSPEQGNWGTVLAFQNGIVGDFSLFNRVELTLATSGGYAGGFKVAISGNGVSKEISLPVDQGSSTWQTISIDAADIPVNMSSIDWIAVYGIGGQIGVSTINVTDFSLIKDEAIAFDSVTMSDYVFISSDAAIASDLIVDGDNNSAAGNIIFGEWSTGTAISDINYLGLDSIQLTAGGGWGAVLALQGDISDGINVDNYDVDMANYTNIKFKVTSQGSFQRYALSIVSKVGNNETAQEVGFSLANQTDWNNIDIDLAHYGVDLSNISQMAVFGVYEGGSASQKIYITDMVLYDSGKMDTSVKDSSDDKFVFFSSTGESTDMIFDGDDSAHNGNTTIGEWSTDTTLTADVIYNGLNAFELKKGSGWGAVLALMGDTYGGVQEYKLDVAKYSTINFKIAAQGAFSAFFIDFIVDGAEFKVPITVNSNWTDVTINVADIPLNLSKLTQIAIFGEGGGTGNTIYITDLNISK